VTHDPDLASTIKERHLAPDIFLWVNDIDAVYAQHRASHADISEELTARPWGVRQYVVREPNGYRLKVAQSQEEDQVEATSNFPSSIRDRLGAITIRHLPGLPRILRTNQLPDKP